MGFRFRYETLLSYRQHLKEKAEIDFARAQQKLRSSQNTLEDLNTKQRMATTQIGLHLKEIMSSDELKNHIHYVNALKGWIKEQEVKVANWEEVVKKKMEILLTKTKQYKVIEKLKEKDQKKWNQEQHLIEQKTMNETAIVRHGKEFR